LGLRIKSISQCSELSSSVFLKIEARYVDEAKLWDRHICREIIVEYFLFRANNWRLPVSKALMIKTAFRILIFTILEARLFREHITNGRKRDESMTVH
jgi:hypothetical protein